ncbi:MAG: ABC transporter ATP-binding protein [Puniceicoccaceae bacterium]|nr:MAG: ABC transporter ATP-binding protein [Puniceicoccaceae bacterium]
MVRCRDVHKSFGAIQAVRGASFDINRGECFGLLGPNGAGKSTIISLIYGAASRGGGDLTVFGLDPATRSRRIKERLGVVTQDNALDEDMGVRSNMMMYARCLGIPRRERRARVDALLEEMALLHRADATIKALSGGMQRRLVFVRALLGRPDLLILDEPTTGLDPAVRLLLWEKVREMKRRGVTLLLTTHYMDEAERLCDRLVIMDQGAIRAGGSPRNLIREHCPGMVAHFDPDPDLRRQLLDTAEADASLHFGEDSAGLYIRAPDLHCLDLLIRRLGLNPGMIRPANLEDVFLAITGKELSADA